MGQHLGSFRTLHTEEHVLLGYVKLFFNIACKDVPCGTYILFNISRDGKNNHAVARNCVMHASRVERNEAEIMLFLLAV